MSNKNSQTSDWEQDAKDMHQKFLKLPESKNKKYYDAMKEHRLRFGSTKHRIDMRPRVFFRTMKMEIILLFLGVSFAVSNIINKLSIAILFPIFTC
jgi:hypothetical protein